MEQDFQSFKDTHSNELKKLSCFLNVSVIYWNLLHVCAFQMTIGLVIKTFKNCSNVVVLFAIVCPVYWYSMSSHMWESSWFKKKTSSKEKLNFSWGNIKVKLQRTVSPKAPESSETLVLTKEYVLLYVQQQACLDIRPWILKLRVRIHLKQDS